MLGKIFKKWVRNDDGVTAIEFSLLLTPYLMLTLGIIEISIMFMSASLMEGATNSAARLIRTGQFQERVDAGEAPDELFQSVLCDYVTVLIDCNEVVSEVQELDSFNDFASAGPQFDEDGNLISTGVVPGGSSERSLIRTGYRYTMVTPLVGTLLGGADRSVLFMSTIVLQSEPYDFGCPTC